ncbi:transglycosylase SLT domain-containing protein [Boseongicola aestuarii]|uniref:Transglycosylase SLT domain protein n=1 Tax=Boseongicola aestuarii TaxID=1470561 RepID=A0A238J3Q1_9RHOB|nr:transglycosylase SLT domain-containing protein [Boseongicola aestuarii]SMX24795.1 Transglycosylase SLT domain protein [Boseongicola aestuarii]
MIGKTAIFLVLMGLGSGAFAQEGPLISQTHAAPQALAVAPASRDNHLPRTSWENRRNGALWTRIALAAVASHGAPLLEVVPRDIAEWCPAYPDQTAENRAAFWAALLSTLSRYESTWNPNAVGGNGRWFGLMQIFPPTAEFRDCRVQTGEGLKRASANLNCAIRIMATTVPRDGAISVKNTRWRGVAADCGPIRNDWKRRDMQRYTRKQTYCRALGEVRPKKRPETQAALAE